jgi:hypothetical protein
MRDSGFILRLSSGIEGKESARRNGIKQRAKSLTNVVN